MSSTVRPGTTWHEQFFAAVGTWPWLADLNERVSSVTQPLYDRHRGDLVVELMHGGRWAGHSLHAALSDLPIGLWASALVLDVVGPHVDVRDGRLDPAATLSAAGCWLRRAPWRRGSPTGRSATGRIAGSGCCTAC